VEQNFYGWRNMTYLERAKERQNMRLLSLKKNFRKEAKRLTQLLVKKGYRFKRLYLFGSVIEGKPFAPWSDIDLAIEGLKKDLFFKVYAFLLKNARFPVDLKPFEEIDKTIKEKINREGEIIYGKG
jgi:predicted nucleotidyltransferase